MRYSSKVKAEAKSLFIDQEMTERAISRHFHGKPSPTQVGNWARKPDPKTGLTWYDERQAKAEQYYLELSPNNLAKKLMEKIWAVLNDKNVEGSKLADQLSKLHKVFAEMSEVDKQIPVMYYMLQDFVEYSKNQFPDIVTEQFIESVRAYKNHIRARLTNDFSS